MAGRGVAAQAVAPRPVIVRIVLLGGDLTMMRKFRLFGVLLLVFVLFPSHAFALDIWPNGSYWAGSTGDGNYASFVRADNLYDAAVYGLNEDPEKLTDEVKAKLSDPSHGGDFYTYAQTFYNVDSWENVPDWLPTYVMFSLTGVIHTWERVFASETSSSLRQSALADYRRVLAGEDLGGGDVPSDSSYIGPYTTVPVYSYNRTTGTINTLSAYNATISDGYLVVGSGSVTVSGCSPSPYYVPSGRVLLSSVAVDFVNEKISSGFNVVVAMNGSGSVIIYGNNLSKSLSNAMGSNMITLFGSNGHYVFFSNTPSGYHYNDSVGLFSIIAYNAQFSVRNLNLRNTFDYMSDVITTPLSAPSNPPSGDWPEPETPVTPDPPEVPTPTAPTVTPDPTPTEPTVIWPTAPVVVNPPEVTVEVTPTGLDYTELLTRINDNLNSIDSYAQAINSGLNSLRPDIIGGFDDVVSAIRNIYTYLQHFDSLLERHCKHIRDSIDDNVYDLELYLKDLLQWLVAQLNYDNLYEYDDSAVTTLLYRILNKIPGGNGPVTYKPNPQSDEPGFFDWLSDLWHRFLIDLVSVLPDELGGLVNAFSQLTHYFPFSIPWDLFALFALFEHEPVTPVFDIPWGYGGESGDVQMIRIDLSVWDGVMSMIRPVFIVGFCFKLAMITKDLLSNFDINKGGI